MTGDEERPPRIPPHIKAAPKVRQMFWCDLPKDAQLPELWKRRPVVIVSFRNTLSGAVTAIPCSTSEQSGNPWALQLATMIDGAVSWAICDKPMTVAVSRLFPVRSGIPRLPEAEFNQILALLLHWLPKIP